MPASRCGKAQLNALRRRQAARRRSEIRLISEVTVQMFNLALDNFIKRGEKPFEAPFHTLIRALAVKFAVNVRNFSLAGASSLYSMLPPRVATMQGYARTLLLADRLPISSLIPR